MLALIEERTDMKCGDFEAVEDLPDDDGAIDRENE